MERKKVSIALPPCVYVDAGPRLEVEGYACHVAGIDMVVHRALSPVPNEAEIGSATPKFSKSYWTVTEPVTGLAIGNYAWRSPTIAAAITVAEHLIGENGGSDGVRARIAEVLETSQRAA